jgi:hypothetical protein
MTSDRGLRPEVNLNTRSNLDWRVSENKNRERTQKNKLEEKVQHPSKSCGVDHHEQATK